MFDKESFIGGMGEGKRLVSFALGYLLALFLYGLLPLFVMVGVTLAVISWIRAG